MNDKWAQVIQSHPATVSRTRYVAKKVARESRRLCPIQSERRGPPRFARFPQNSDPTKSANSRSICQTRDFLRSVAQRLLSSKVHSTKEKNGSRRLKEKLLISTKRSLVQDGTCPEHKSRSEILSTPSSLEPRSIRGLMMKSCT